MYGYTQEKTYSRENEIAKMDKLISFVREPLLEPGQSQADTQAST